MHLPRLLLVAAALFVLPASSWAAGPETAEARAVADRWIAEVDAGNYAGSWAQASASLRREMPIAQWQAYADALRGRLGAMQERKVVSAEATTSLEGMPRGQYVRIDYQTAFERRKRARETVGLRLEADGSWRVLGYFMR